MSYVNQEGAFITCANPECGSKIPTFGRSRLRCQNCGWEYCQNCEGLGRVGLNVGNPDEFSSFIIGLLVGGLLVAPFVWTPLGRDIAVTQCSRAYRKTKAHTERKIREWHEKRKSK